MVDDLDGVPPRLVDGRGGLLEGLWAGRVTDDPVIAVRGRGGRVRRWSYAATGGDGGALGAAVADLGIAATAFVWFVTGTSVWTWERTVVGRAGITVPDRPDAPAAACFADGGLTIDPRGGLRVDVPVEGGRLVARSAAQRGTPAVCATATPRGGWNVTQKHAGYATSGSAAIAGRSWDVGGGGWSDWTAGRQDRRTSWRWAAGAGRAPDGRRVGLNVSTGMNGSGAGEDVIWWDGVPHALDAQVLGPADDADLRGTWTLTGAGCDLTFRTAAVRAADENLILARSRYVQPIGRFSGTVPGPGGEPVEVELVGVTEDHHARW